MRTLFAGAMLLALIFPAVAADIRMPLVGDSDCVPYADMLHAIDLAGGRVLGQYDAPFTRNARVLYFEYAGVVAVAGIARGTGCVNLPAAIVGHLGVDKGVL